MRISALALGGALLVLLYAACDRARQERHAVTEVTSETELTSAAVELIPARIAIDRVIAAQCSREQLCVEEGRVDETKGSCSAHVRGPLGCEGRVVDPRLLDECLHAIDAASCEIKLEARSTIEACNADVLCAR